MNNWSDVFSSKNLQQEYLFLAVILVDDIFTYMVSEANIKKMLYKIDKENVEAVHVKGTGHNPPPYHSSNNPLQS